MKKPFLFVVTICMSGCATMSSDSTKDIVPIGKDTFMVGRSANIFVDSGSEVKASLYRDANDFCVSQGKNLMPLSASSKDKIIGVSAASAELHFRCLMDSDPEFVRPTVRTTPDVTIESRQEK